MNNVINLLLAVTPLMADAGDFEKHHESTGPMSAFVNRHPRELKTSFKTPSLRAATIGAPGVVEKTVFSSKMRMVFLVGLEGSGHHFMNSVLNEVCAFDTVRCPKICPIAEVLINEVSTPNTTLEYGDGLEKLRNAMDALALTMKESDEETAMSVATFQDCHAHHVGQMSFPNFGGRDKALQYVDLRILAAEAERANIDLRIIFLSRSAEEILISTTKHRQFGRWVLQCCDSCRQNPEALPKRRSCGVLSQFWTDIFHREIF